MGEKSARGIDGRTYSWGEGFTCNKVNTHDPSKSSYCVGDTNKVGSYESGRSPYDIYDLTGNVWEWTADWYSETYYQISPSSNPVGPSTGQWRVMRGGSWGNGGTDLPTFHRGALVPDKVSDLVGFRCAIDAAQ